jgi:hypothetical protein
MNVLAATGQAFVREGGSYLAVGAACHGPAHKHADDTGFLLIENNQVVLGDAGRWGYYEDEPDRAYARSAAAHNVLTVDGHDFEWRGAEPYGSGIEAADEDRGWYTIVVRNPLLARQGVEHRRVLSYRPGEALVVLDEMRSTEQHEYTRHLHFGPGLNAVAGDGEGRIELTGKGIGATVEELGDIAQLSLHRGAEDPLLGWTYPGDRERVSVHTATWRHRASDATFASVVTLGDEPIQRLPDRVARYL